VAAVVRAILGLFRGGVPSAATALSEPEVGAVLAASRLAHVAIDTTRGPVVTPVLFGVAKGELWCLVRRQSLKARVLRKRPRAGVLVRHGDRAVALNGDARLLSPTHPLGCDRSCELAATPFADMGRLATGVW